VISADRLEELRQRAKREKVRVGPDVPDPAVRILMLYSELMELLENYLPTIDRA
jgi:hypothetical protein